MFERYTEQARRVVFFARYEASALGSPSLLGLILEPESIAGEILRAAGVHIDDAREEVRLSAQGKRPTTESGHVFQRLVEFLEQLDRRRAAYHVVPFHGAAVRVEIALPDERWAAKFFTDGHVTVEVFSLSSNVQDESSLARLLDRVGPEHEPKG